MYCVCRFNQRRSTWATAKASAHRIASATAVTVRVLPPLRRRSRRVCIASRQASSFGNSPNGGPERAAPRRKPLGHANQVCVTFLFYSALRATIAITRIATKSVSAIHGSVTKPNSNTLRTAQSFDASHGISVPEGSICNKC